MTVLFNSSRPLGRCENLTAVWDAWDGPKRFVQVGYGDMSAYPEDVVVTDEFVAGKRPGQTVVMVEHGPAGGKLYGCDQKRGQYTRERCALVDWFVTSSEHGRAFNASAAGIPVERCPALGFPRTDAYFGRRKGDGGTYLAEYPRAYLYAPTFRAGYDEPLARPDWALLDSLLEDGEALVVKRHMHQRDWFLDRDYAHIGEADSADASAPYLIDCDVLATDFSSILFDAYVLGKPSVLAADAGDPYLESRGMYMDYPADYGSRAVSLAGHEREFVELLRDAAENGMGDAELRCRELTAGACDSRSTVRVIELVRSLP